MKTRQIITFESTDFNFNKEELEIYNLMDRDWLENLQINLKWGNLAHIPLTRDCIVSDKVFKNIMLVIQDRLKFFKVDFFYFRDKKIEIEIWK